MGGGGTSPLPVDGTGGGGGGGTQFIYDILNTIYNLLVGVFGRGGSAAQTDLITVGTTAVNIYNNPKLVKKAIIQNLSATDVVTIVALQGTPGKVAPIAAGKGTLLNPASSVGQGGGSMPLGNVDLGMFTAVTNTNSSQTISVYYEY